MKPFLSATVVSNDSIGDGVRNLILRPEQKVDYSAGQFFIIRLRDAQGEYVERSYSAANFAAEDGSIEFVIRIDPKGHLSPLIADLSEGDTLDIKGPFGRFGLSMAPEGKKIVFVAGGVGISPIRCMIQELASQESNMPLQLFYGFRSEKDFLFEEELKAHTQVDSFELFSAASDESYDGNEHFKGFIHLTLEGNVFEASPDVACFICGPPPMVKAAREQLMQLGFERGQIHLEAW